MSGVNRRVVSAWAVARHRTSRAGPHLRTAMTITPKNETPTPTSSTAIGNGAPQSRTSARAATKPDSVARARSIFQWMFRSRETGRITIMQRPNLALTMALIAIVSARLGRCMIVIRPVSRLRNIHWKIERARATESGLVAARALVRDWGAPLPIAVLLVGVGVSFLGVIVIAVLRWGPAREVRCRATAQAETTRRLTPDIDQPRQVSG